MKHKDMKIKLGLLLFLLCVTLCPAWAQSFSVTGTVVDEQSEPVIGASILVKGTNRGMITDMDGKFHLSDVRASDVLVISFVGLQTQEVKAKERMRIVLTSTSEELDEVIVTAFGTAKKSAFTGSATVLNKATIEKKQVTNVLQSLAGEVPGLQMAPSTAPGSTSSILIRGEGSINAGTDPLIVLDGMIYEGGWNNINPQDVESITDYSFAYDDNTVTISKVDETTVKLLGFYWCSEELIGTVDVAARTITFEPQVLGSYYTFAQETDEQAPVVATIAEDGSILIKGWGAWYGGYTYIEGAETKLSKQ